MLIFAMIIVFLTFLGLEVEFSGWRRNSLKYVSKICGQNFEIVAVTRPCIRFFLIQIAFQSSDRVELDF